MKMKWMVGSILLFCFLIIGQQARACYWYFDKTTPNTEITLSLGQTYNVPYQIAVAAWFSSQIPPVSITNPTHLDACSGYIFDAFEGEIPISIGMYQYPDDLNTLKVFPYYREIRFDVCGNYQINNEASLKINPKSTLPDLTDSVTINVQVPCFEGCSLTPGYWKTHSRYGPAPYDDAWALLTPNQEDSTFFLSGKTWYEVLWTPPAKGNPYYILAHQYIAAYLNRLNGANTTEVNGVMAAAEALFNEYTPATAAQNKSEFINAAYALDEYNNGITGPGHCSE